MTKEEWEKKFDQLWKEGQSLDLWQSLCQPATTKIIVRGFWLRARDEFLLMQRGAATERSKASTGAPSEKLQ